MVEAGVGLAKLMEMLDLALLLEIFYALLMAEVLQEMLVDWVDLGEVAMDRLITT